jgi:DNA repair ATPase RecN
MYIEKTIDSVMDFYFWISSQTGFNYWQLLILMLAVLFLLSRLLKYLQKARLRKKYFSNNTDRREIIGINLSGTEQKEIFNNSSQNQADDNITEENEYEEQKSWGQTTKQWRQLREKIRHLQHEITKHERSAMILKEQITELQTLNNKLQSEINRQKQIKPEVIEQQNQIFSDVAQEKSFLQVSAVNPVSKNILENQGQSFDNNSNTIEEISKDDSEYTDANSPENNQSSPLNIKELKVIADLAKQVQARSQHGQNE